MNASASATTSSEPTGTPPFSAFEWMVALRYLMPHRKGGVASLIAVLSFLSFLIGVAALIIVMSVMNGFRVELQSKILGFNGHIVVSPYETPLTDYDAVTSRIAKVPGVTLAVPFVEGQVLVSSPFSASGALVRGMKLEDLKRLPGLANNIKDGTLDNFDQGQGVVIGARLASSLGLQIGDGITLISPKGDQTAFGTTPRMKVYPVVATFEVGMSDIDSGFVIMPLQESQAYFNRDGDATAIEVYIENPDHVQSESEAIKAGAGRPVSIVDWRQRNSAFFTALQVERNVMFMILLILVIMAALGVVSSMVMLVQSKQTDIAIMRTMGATRGAMLRIFFITGMAIGLLGTIFGLLLGLLVCRYIENIQEFISWLSNTQLFASEIYFLSRLPAKTDPTEVTVVVVTTLILCFLATLYPAWRAAKLDPVEALRGG
ncbi:lipoprotein-releasing ABC transporter permease subunit [Labrys sp. LIt4]|uniref:Lipoprotein-releasing system transmembrane subunit LolC n=1 Tax=Labrys okinawensis TaxID=346911 RepID=A0A2S9Q6Y1_9HYPH|nr:MULTISPECIES: lipoprotein-releasing ABC transporter permease subunit [Labrys]MBP0578974.1 lipoprotein-releasing ABC transporter permease subunit [Labrys sp. LIt4]PRH85097.1 lipoprotein-releasing system transmembrane subunit LolC [Labrys okinawensis]